MTHVTLSILPLQVVVGCLVEDAEDMELFLNSISSAGRAGINKNKFCVFTTNKQVYTDMKNTGIKVALIEIDTTVANRPTL